MTQRLLSVIIILLFAVGCGGGSATETAPEVLTPVEVDDLPDDTTADVPEPEGDAIPTEEAVPAGDPETAPFERVTVYDFAVDDQLFHSDLSPGPDPGSLWIHARKDAALYRDGESEVFSVGEGELVVGVDRVGRLWFSREDGTEVGYFEVDGTTVRYDLDDGWGQVPGISTSLEVPQIDSRGWVWIATPADIRVLRDDRWWIATPPDLQIEPASQTNPIVSAFSVSAIGEQVWVGHCYYGPPGAIMDALGVRYFDGEEWQETPIREGCARSIRQDDAGTIWVGDRDAVWWLDAVTGAWSNQTLPAFTEAQFIYVEDFLLDPNGDVWAVAPACGGASCFGRGVIYRVFEDGTSELVDVADSTLIDNWAIFQLSDGQTILFWDRQFQYVDGVTLAPVVEASVVDAVQDGTGQIWATVWTDAGLELWRLPVP